MLIQFIIKSSCLNKILTLNMIDIVNIFRSECKNDYIGICKIDPEYVREIQLHVSSVH